MIFVHWLSLSLLHGAQEGEIRHWGPDHLKWYFFQKLNHIGIVWVVEFWWFKRRFYTFIFRYTIKWLYEVDNFISLDIFTDEFIDIFIIITFISL